MDIVNKLPIDIMLNIYSYIGPKLLYVNNKELFNTILSMKNDFKKKGIRVYYQIQEVITQTTDKYYNPKYNVFAEYSTVYRGGIDIGRLTNINTICSSKYFNTLLPKTKYELLIPSAHSYPNFKIGYKKMHYEYNYIKVDNICEFKNYQLVWKKYT